MSKRRKIDGKGLSDYPKMLRYYLFGSTKPIKLEDVVERLMGKYTELRRRSKKRGWRYSKFKKKLSVLKKRDCGLKERLREFYRLFFLPDSTPAEDVKLYADRHIDVIRKEILAKYKNRNYISPLAEKLDHQRVIEERKGGYHYGFGAVNLCSIRVPIDVLILILSFFPSNRTRKMLLLINSVFNYAAIVTWASPIRIGKTNYMNFPTLLLDNVRQWKLSVRPRFVLGQKRFFHRLEYYQRLQVLEFSHGTNINPEVAVWMKMWTSRGILFPQLRKIIFGHDEDFNDLVLNDFVNLAPRLTEFVNVSANRLLYPFMETRVRSMSKRVKLPNDPLFSKENACCLGYLKNLTLIIHTNVTLPTIPNLKTLAVFNAKSNMKLECQETVQEATFYCANSYQISPVDSIPNVEELTLILGGLAMNVLQVSTYLRRLKRLLIVLINPDEGVEMTGYDSVLDWIPEKADVEVIYLDSADYNELSCDDDTWHIFRMRRTNGKTNVSFLPYRHKSIFRYHNRLVNTNVWNKGLGLHVFEKVVKLNEITKSERDQEIKWRASYKTIINNQILSKEFHDMFNHMDWGVNATFSKLKKLARTRIREHLGLFPVVSVFRLKIDERLVENIIHMVENDSNATEMDRLWCDQLMPGMKYHVVKKENGMYVLQFE